MTFISNSLSFCSVLGGRSPSYHQKNMPGTHQYAVTRVAQIMAQILGVLLKQNLVDKISWYMRFFLVLPNKYYTFVTSPFLSPSPSPAPFCSIFRGPNRLDLWLDLCLKLLFECQTLWKVTAYLFHCDICTLKSFLEPGWQEVQEDVFVWGGCSDKTTPFLLLQVKPPN